MSFKYGFAKIRLIPSDEKIDLIACIRKEEYIIEDIVSAPDVRYFSKVCDIVRKRRSDNNEKEDNLIRYIGSGYLDDGENQLLLHSTVSVEMTEEIYNAIKEKLTSGSK